jgi:cytochrome c biogenesis protein
MNRRSATAGRAFYDLMSSMRFAISLLTLISIASIVGTVLKQAEPYQNYIIQFGPFWFEVFKLLGLYDVYHAAWFVLIMAFLVASLSLCITRNTPSMLREMKTFRENITESSLKAFAHQHATSTALDPQTLAQRTEQYLQTRAYKVRSNVRGEGILLSAKQGTHNRWGYFLAHASIILICIGGLIDGNLVFKVQQLLGYKKIETRNIPQSQVAEISRLGPGNPSFRGSVDLPENGSADVVFLNVADGYLVQDLPFVVALKDFRIEHYTTGQPKSFESDLSIFSHDGRLLKEATIAVNKPLIYDGIAIYQASFGDGGTRLKLQGWNLQSAEATPFPVEGRIHDETRLASHHQEYTLEFNDFRPFNIENLNEAPPEKNAMTVLGGNPARRDTAGLRNVGPSFQYKVRDAQGQAREYSNYMLPIQVQDRWFLMSGVRDAPNEPFRYVRFPLDAKGKPDSFMALRAVFRDAAARNEIARRFALNALPPGKRGETLWKLEDSARRILQIFGEGGYQALGKFIDENIPAAERESAAQTYLRILELSGFEALRYANEQAKIPPPEANDATGWLVRDSLNAYSDLFFYGSPVYLQLMQYDEVKSSGLQLTRSPGKNLVYLGSILLVIGIFFMLYVRERRLWVWIKPGSARLAMSSPKRTLDFEREFAQHSEALDRLGKE